MQIRSFVPQYLRRVTFATLLLFFGAPAILWADTPFVQETVPSQYDIGAYASLALDAEGKPHIAYRDYNNNGLLYARKSGAVWTIESVDSGTVGLGSHASLALDPQGNPHVAYYAGDVNGLRYRVKSGGTWSPVENVDTGARAGQYASLALDSLGNPHIAYFDATNNKLRYKRKTGVVWPTTAETPDLAVNVGQYASLALDAQGKPHIAYYDAANFRLKYARKIGFAWQTPEIADSTPPDVGKFASLALDSRGNPHIAYFDATNNKLRYMRRIGGWPTPEIVDDTGGGDISLALDSLGNPRVAYAGLRYAFKVGTVWTIPDPVDFIGQYASLALDRQGNPSIAYYAGHALKYAASAVQLHSPIGGEQWNAGSVQTVRWTGAGSVDILLSIDGGLTYNPLLTRISKNQVLLTVPAVTTSHARIRISRSSPFSTSDSPGFFTIAP